MNLDTMKGNPSDIALLAMRKLRKYRLNKRAKFEMGLLQEAGMPYPKEVPEAWKDYYYVDSQGNEEVPFIGQEDGDDENFL